MDARTDLGELYVRRHLQDVFAEFPHLHRVSCEQVSEHLGDGLTGNVTHVSISLDERAWEQAHALLEEMQHTPADRADTDAIATLTRQVELGDEDTLRDEIQDWFFAIDERAMSRVFGADATGDVDRDSVRQWDQARPPIDPSRPIRHEDRGAQTVTYLARDEFERWWKDPQVGARRRVQLERGDEVIADKHHFTLAQD